MSPDCVICSHLGRHGGGATNLIGLMTSVECLLACATRQLDDRPQGETHVMAHVCSQHVVEIYRGRVPGVAMAWKAATSA